MARESNTLVLKNGFGDLTAPMSFIVGIPDVTDGASYLNFRLYMRRFLGRIKTLPKAKLDPGHMLESAYEDIFSGSEDFSSSNLLDGFLYPKRYEGYYGGDDGLHRVNETIVEVLRSKALVSLGYRSARRGFSGDPILVTRPYIGRVEKISDDRRSIQLKIGTDYRTFRIAELQWLLKFSNQYADGAMKHLHMTFSPLDGGKAVLQWQVIDGENSPLLAEPWHEPLQPEERQLLKEPEPSADAPSEEEIFAALRTVTHEQELEETRVNSDDLTKYYGTYLRIEVYSHETLVEVVHMKLLATRFNPQNNALKLIGEGAVEVSAPKTNLKFYELEEL